MLNMPLRATTAQVIQNRSGNEHADQTRVTDGPVFMMSPRVLTSLLRTHPLLPLSRKRAVLVTILLPGYW